jgi:hypothetical protein
LGGAAGVTVSYNASRSNSIGNSKGLSAVHPITQTSEKTTAPYKQGCQFAEWKYLITNNIAEFFLMFTKLVAPGTRQ